MFAVETAVPAPLLRRYWLVVAAAAAATGLAWVVIRRAAPELAGGWLPAAAGVLALQLLLLRRFLPQNGLGADGEIRPNFGPGNTMTLLRGVLVAWLAGFLVAPWPGGWLAWAPAVLFTAAGLLDVFDGVAARLSGHTTRLGATLDMEYDAMSFITVNLLVIRYGQLPWWYIVVGLARYLFVLGLWWRQRRGLPVHDLTESMDRRAQAGLMWGMMTVMLWPVFAPPATTVGGIGFGLPFGLIFLRDWLVVSGRLDADSAEYHRLRTVARSIMQRWLPVLARLTLVALVVGGWIRLDLTAGLGLLGAVAVGLALLGLFGRIAALGAVAYCAFSGLPDGYSAALLLGLFCAIWIVTWGPGALALWTPESAIFARRYG